VLSLVSVLQHLDKPDTLGPSISAAFLATFYGVAAANVVYLPIANALKKMTAIEAGERLLMIEGVLSIQSGDNPRILAEKLWSFLPPDQRETADDAEAASAPSGAAEPAAQAA
jgi:chemotaxis protein MotA